VKRLTNLVCCAALLAVGCSNGADSRVDQQPVPPQVEAPDEPKPGERPPVADPIDRPTPGAVGVDVDDEGEAGLRPVIEDAPPARPRRRLNIDQLSDAMIKASGGIGWTELRGNATVDLLAELSRTLGKPDYIQITEEDLEPTILFQKFLGDAARSICSRMLERDLATIEVIQEYEMRPFEDPPEGLPERTLMIHVTPDQSIDEDPEAFDANIRALLMRFHGRVIAEGDDVALANWRWLLKSARHVSEPSQAWMATCVALYTHPDFYSF